MTVTMEVFSGSPPCQDCIESLKLADEYDEKYKGELQVNKLVGKEASAKFAEYKLSCTPAIIINGKIRIEGIYPSYDTLNAALQEGGLSIK